MKITIKTNDPKKHRRFKRWVPFIEKAFARLRNIIPDTAKLPYEITLKPLRNQRIPGADYAFCNYWGENGQDMGWKMLAGNGHESPDRKVP